MGRDETVDPAEVTPPEVAAETADAPAELAAAPAVVEPEVHPEPDVEQIEADPTDETGLTVDALEELAARRGRAGMYVDPQVQSDIDAARNVDSDAAAQAAALDELATAEPYIDPQVERDAQAARDAELAAALPPEAMTVPDTYVDPLDGVPAAPTIAPAGQVLITHPDLPGPPIGSCFPDAFADTWQRNGWVLVDPPEPDETIDASAPAFDDSSLVEPITEGGAETPPENTADGAPAPDAPTNDHDTGDAGTEG